MSDFTVFFGTLGITFVGFLFFIIGMLSIAKRVGNECHSMMKTGLALIVISFFVSEGNGAVPGNGQIKTIFAFLSAISLASGLFIVPWSLKNGLAKSIDSAESKVEEVKLDTFEDRINEIRERQRQKQA